MGPRGRQGTPQGEEKLPSGLLRLGAWSLNRFTAYLQGILAPRTLPPPKNEAIVAVARSAIHSSFSSGRGTLGRHRSMAASYLQWILLDASESPAKMRRSATGLCLISRFCVFAIFAYPLYYFFGLCWVYFGPSLASEGSVTIHSKYGAISNWAS